MTSTFATATGERVRELIAGPPGLRVSLYVPVPVDPGFDEQRAFPGRYRAAVNEVAQRLATLGVAAPKAADTVRRLEHETVELGALHPSTRGICVLLGPGGLRRLATTRAVPAAVHVGRTFHLRPLLAGAHDDLTYRVVSLTTNRVELFDGDAWGLARVEGERVPGSLVEALGSELSEGALQFHKGEAGHNGLIYHGHGGASRERGVDRERFHRVLAGALEKAWSARNDPVVLVAGPAHDGRFRGVAQLAGLLEEGVPQNPKGWSDAELFERAFGVVRRWLEERDRRGLEEARAAVASGRGTDVLATAAESAAAGRVAQVWVASEARVPMHVDATSGALLDALGDEDALDELCALVLARGGSAAVTDAIGGSGSPLLARFRG